MKLRVTLFFLLAASCSFAQVNNDSLEFRIRPDSAHTGAVYLDVHNFNYLRNYEFFNDFQDGYTLYGTQLVPQLVYYPHPKLAVRAGILLRKDFGTEGVYKTYPLFALVYRNKATTLINGALEGHLHHRMIQPLYDLERAITDPVEYGTQVIVDKPGFFLDGFINWKKMIYKPAPEQEQIVAGGSSRLGVINRRDWQVNVPVQLTVFHQGGQIDTLNRPLKTLLNSTIGVRISRHRNSWARKVELGGHYVTYRELSPTKVNSFSSGSGWLFDGSADFAFGSFHAGYWTANGFISPLGMPVYQSVSQQIDHAGYAQRKRELLLLGYFWQKELVPGFRLDFRVEPVMDMGAGKRKFEFFHSLFLTYKHEFRMVREKR